MFKKRMKLCLAVFLVCIGIAASVKEKSSTRTVSEKLIAQIDFSSWISEIFVVSPDSRRVTYVAMVGDKPFVVVDGKEGKRYDDIVGEIIFDSPDTLHYPALKGNSIYLVKERIKCIYF